MPELTTPPSPKKGDFIDTPPTSPCDHEAIISSTSPLVIRTSSPDEFRRKVKSVFASLYDEEPTPKCKVEPEQVIELASPLWKDADLELVPGNEPEVEENKEALEKPGVDRMEAVDGHSAKEMLPSLESTDAESPEKTAEEVLSMAFTETGLTEAIISSSIHLDMAPVVLVDPVETIHSASYTDVTEVSQMEHGPSTIKGEAEKIKIRHEWTGTCQFDLITEKSIELQKENQLDGLILYRKALVHDMTIAPHDPFIYIDLANLDAKLAFKDTSSHYAYRALMLIKAGLQTITLQQSELSRLVYTAVATRLYTSSTVIIIDELQSMCLQAYRCLVQGLMQCAAFWDGLTVVKLGLEDFPGDFELLDLQALLLGSFQNRHEEILEDAKNGSVDNITASSRSGLIYQKKYPWMAPKLFVRTPRLVRQVNSTFDSLNAEVRPVVFGSPGTASKSKSLSDLPKNADVGPLGIFATRDIEEGESILVDKTHVCVSNIPPSTGQFCDACHAHLALPFVQPIQICRPSCGCNVSFCSKGCHDLAIESYHKIQCGIDFTWLYKTGASRTEWDPRMFLRVICIVLSTPGWSKESTSQKNPLQHPLLARLTANYARDDEQAIHGQTWSYQENIVAPTRILRDLGIDIFSPVKKIHEGKTKFLANSWTPELIQSIYWRMLNNANNSAIDIPGLQLDESFCSIRTPKSGPTMAHLIVISPSYSFFNHSCRYNVMWNGTCLNGAQDISALLAGDGPNQEVLKPGSSSVSCRANRDIKAGEELTISYVGDPMGGYSPKEIEQQPKLAIGQSEDGAMSHKRIIARIKLMKWFNDAGCGCGQCAEENGSGRMLTMGRAS
ncbi:putative mynd domain protein [Botrytis fragariae]|uniref:Putative mynd domain protein n=1 Tax=Botrytis fragariae TaxID=1964551 RepID=A0A8H6EL50_9HELO|nr:putative mynd domain protein [Botrytis fragariae]KAF5876209.1 putative mynd domain protein [Botrytis fragariae]